MILELEVDRDTDASIHVYDIAGHEVKRLFAGRIAPGVNRYQWDTTAGKPLPAGVYLIRARAGSRATTTRVVLMR